MAGNTKGKLKEHFEGIHRDMNWGVYHVNASLILIATRLSQQPDFEKVKGDKDKEESFFMKHPVYKAIKSLGEGIQVLDKLAQEVYKKL